MIWQLLVISLAVFGSSAASVTKRSNNYGSENNYQPEQHQCLEAAFLGQLFVSLAETFNNMAQQLTRHTQMLNNQPNRHGDHYGYSGHRGRHHGYGHHYMPPQQKPFYGGPPPPVYPFFGPPSDHHTFDDGSFLVTRQGRNPFLKTPNPPANPPTFSSPPAFLSPPPYPKFPGSWNASPQLPNNENNNWRANKPTPSQLQPPSQAQQPKAQPVSQTMDRSGLDDQLLQVLPENSKDNPSNRDLQSAEDIDQPTEDTLSPDRAATGDENESEWNQLVHSIFDEN